MSAPPPLPLLSPPTPVMLYIGAGYDLSPLLSFAPGGPPYPIVTLSEQDHVSTGAPSETPYEHDTYTSFLFVDAKPRYTSAYMISDFHEWTSIEARVRNVLHYSQGTLSRWRTVPGAPDLLWFEGGGDAALLESRSRNPAWVFHDPIIPEPSVVSSCIQPLTTLLYLFNTLDVELVRAPLLENVWPRVEALYVHGLRLHVRTGVGMDFGGPAVLDVSTSVMDAHGSSSGMRACAEVGLHGETSQTPLGTGLKRCYVITGSWGTPFPKARSTRHKASRAQREGGEKSTADIGVRHVDFVREAWRRRKAEGRTRAEPVGGGWRLCGAGSHIPMSTSPASIPSPPPISTTSSSTPSSTSTTLPSLIINPALLSQTSVPTSPLIFRRRRIRHSRYTHQDCHSDSGWDSDYDGDSEDAYSGCDESTHEYSHDPDEAVAGNAMPESTSSSSAYTVYPFHVRIPQLAWSSTLRGGRGGYFVAKTVEESVGVWRTRREGRAEWSEGDESGSGEEFDIEAGTRAGMTQTKKRVQYLDGLRSLFAIRPQTLPALPAFPHTKTSTSIIPRSRKPPLRSRPRLRPRPPIPATDSEGSESENSTTTTVYGAGHSGIEGVGEACGCESGKEGKDRAVYEYGMGSEKESVAYRFWPRGLRARRGMEEHGCLRVCVTRGIARARARAIPYIGRDTMHIPVPAPASAVNDTTVGTPTHIASPASRNPTSHSPLFSRTSTPPYPIPIKRASRERRIDIAGFLSTTSEPYACDVVDSVSSNAASISNSVPVTFASDTARDYFTPVSAPAVSTFYPMHATSTFPSSSSASLSLFSSPASLLTTFPRSPYGPSGLHDNDDVEPEKQGVRSSKKRRMLRLAFGMKAEQPLQKGYEWRPGTTRSLSMSGLFRWKTSMMHDRDAKPLSSTNPRTFPAMPQPQSQAPTAPTSPSRPPASEAHVRAHSHASASVGHRYRFDPDAGAGHQFRARAYSDARYTHKTPPASIHDLLERRVSTPARQSNESDQTRVGD